MSNYTHMLLAICTVGEEPTGNALAAVAGHSGLGPAFGNVGDIAGNACRPVGSGGAATHWFAFNLARQEAVDKVSEFNTAGPYPTLNALGVNDAVIAHAKTVLVAQCYPRETHENALADVLAAHGFEVIQ